MKRGPLLLVVTVTFVIAGVLWSGCNSGSTPAAGPVDGNRAMAHVAAMVALGPRPAGSAALLANRDYIKKHVASLGLKPETQDWTDPASGLRMHNVWTEIPGANPKSGPVLIFAAHFDTKICSGHEDQAHNFPFVGAIDGAGGSAVLLELAGHLGKRKNVPNIWILWLDGEESIPWDWNKDNSRALHGSKYFVKTMSADKTRFPKGLKSRLKAFVLIDLIGSKNQKIDRDKASNGTLNDLFLEAATAMGEGDRMYESTSTMTDDHIPFKDAGIRVIDLIDFNYRAPDTSGNQQYTDPRYEQWWHTAKDNLKAMDPKSLEFVGNLLWNALPLLEAKIYATKKKTKKQ
jgi:Zn-dependent M28 family amino/carboxypeptidase